VCGEEAELGLVDEGEKILNLLFQRGLLLVLLGVGVGILRAGVGVAEAGRHVVFVDLGYSLLLRELYSSCQHAIGEQSIVKRSLRCS